MEDEMHRAYSMNGIENEYIYVIYNIYIGRKARRKEPLGRPRRRWVVNIKMEHREIGWFGLD
jgi:hypothetical protein